MSNLAIAQKLAPWVGIGVSGSWDNSTDALDAADMNFTVYPEKIFWDKPDGILLDEIHDTGYQSQYVSMPEMVDMFANVRGDTNQVLGCVTPQYRIIQNKDAFSLIDPFIQGNDGVITNAGMTADGLCFMVARIINSRGIGGEPYEINLMVTNSFNTKYPCQIIMVPLRIICQNMYRRLVNDKILLAKHTLNVNERVISIAQSKGIDKKIDTFKMIIESAQAIKITKAKLNSLIEMMFPYPKEGPREEAYRIRTDNLRRDFIESYFDAPDNAMHKDSSFGFINAYYDWISHRSAPRETSMKWNERRFNGIVNGVDINTHVLKEAMK